MGSTDAPAKQQPFWKRAIVPIVLLTVACVLAIVYAGKAAEGRSAFVRWRPQIQSLVAGENVYEAAFIGDEDEDDPDQAYPNPPLLAIVLYPLTLLPPVAGAVTWFMIKAIMVWWLLDWANRLAAGRGRASPDWATAIVFIFSIRPILGDLQHGNVNILIAFLVVAGLWLFAHGRDVWAGLTIALATAFKVTPALFIIYFAWKRQWRTLIASLSGLVLFLLVVPGFVLGPLHNVELLGDWYRAMVRPYAVEGQVETRQHNQSLPGFVHRWLTPSEGIELRGHEPEPVNVASVDAKIVRSIVRGLSLGMIVLLAWLCRARTDDRLDWRLACEYSLVILAMLILSERTWKHHYTVIVLPLAVIAAHWALRAAGAWRWVLPGTLIAVFLLMGTTSSELGGWLAPDGNGHKYAQALGAYLWLSVLLFGVIGMVLHRNRIATPQVTDEASGQSPNSPLDSAGR